MTPEELSVIAEECDIHHKLPIQYGGTNDFDNLLLVSTSIHLEITNMKTLSPINSRS